MKTRTCRTHTSSAAERVHLGICRRHPDIRHLPQPEREVARGRGWRADLARGNAGRGHEAAVVGVAEDGGVDRSGSPGGSLDRCSAGVARPLVDLLDGVDLRRGQAGRGFRAGALQGLPIREHECRRIELRSAGTRVMDDAVRGTVERVAGGEQRAGEQVLVGDGQRRVQDRTAVGQRRDRRRRDRPVSPARPTVPSARSTPGQTPAERRPGALAMDSEGLGYAGRAVCAQLPRWPSGSMRVRLDGRDGFHVGLVTDGQRRST